MHFDPETSSDPDPCLQYSDSSEENRISETLLPSPMDQ